MVRGPGRARQGEAVHELGRPEARDIRVSEFQARVAETQVQVEMAEIDAEAWEKKVQVRQDALDVHLARLSDTRDRQN